MIELGMRRLSVRGREAPESRLPRLGIHVQARRVIRNLAGHDDGGVPVVRRRSKPVPRGEMSTDGAAAVAAQIPVSRGEVCTAARR
jgi:hypothetical protein